MQDLPLSSLRSFVDRSTPPFSRSPIGIATEAYGRHVTDPGATAVVSCVLNLNALAPPQDPRAADTGAPRAASTARPSR